MQEDIKFILTQLVDYGKIELGTEASKKLIKILTDYEFKLKESDEEE